MPEHETAPAGEKAPRSPGGSGAADWHSLDTADVLSRLGSGANGLSARDAAARLETHGPNRLPQARGRGPLARFAAQFHNLLIYVLIGCAAISAAIGHVTDALVIVGVVIVNAAIGFLQEGKAEKALEAIRGMIDPTASVLRDGRRTTVPADRIVPGDVVLLEAGDRVAADLRLVRARSLRIDEAILTGESVPVDKGTAPVAADAPLGDRSGVAFSGTFVTAGQGAGVVVATGPATELGRISTMLGSVVRLTTPLIRQMDQFARQVAFAVLAVSALVFAYAVLVGGYEVADAFMVVVGITVAGIPEGLPAVLTIALAVGVQRMARRNAIVRQLPAVETLGSVSVICSDKTGTLTRNEMTVRTVVLSGSRITVEGAGYEPAGGFLVDGAATDPAADPVLEDLTLAALLCNDAALVESDGGWSVTGDPMEGALVCVAAKAGHETDAARDRFARLDEIPFDSRHRYMATLHDLGAGRRMVFVKGAPERIFAMCPTEVTATGLQPTDVGRWQEAVADLAADGQRVLAFARMPADAEMDDIGPDDIEGRCALLGIVGLIDPPRPEAIAAVEECAAAGIRVKMITGDHAETARAIARQLRIADDPTALTGGDLDGVPGDRLAEVARQTTVFARTSPEHKLRLVEALQSDGAIVAMTGDGVNDAPALKRADVGVAMGGKGTEAAKEASEMVLADDNFASIVAAVREGRTVYDNLTKVIAFSLPTNGGEALTIIAAVIFGLTLPVTPVQILWINMITAVALGLVLAFEPTEPNVMRRPPRRADSSLLTARLVWQIAFVSVLILVFSVAIYTYAIRKGHSVELARTMVVNAMVVMEIFYLFSVRYVHGTSLTLAGVVGTRIVLGGVALVTAAQFAFTYLSSFQAIFDSRPVPFVDGLLVVATGIALLLVVEAEKRIAGRNA